MAGFTMCAACAAEYADPADRRFHAQPNACARLRTFAGAGRTRHVARPIAPSADRDSLTIIREARALLRAGKILAVKGLGGFLLACDAANDAAVAELRRRKRRSDKPFALMARDLAAVRQICAVLRRGRGSAARACAAPSWYCRALARRCASPPRVAPGNDTLGVMLPYTPLHYLLFSDSPDAASEFTGAGDDQRQPERRAHCHLERGGAAPARRRRGLVSAAQPRHRDARGRLGGAHLRRPPTRAAAFARLRPADHRPGHRDAGGAGLRRRAEEHLLPDQGPLRDPEPAYRRPGKLRDHAVLRGDARQPAAHLPRFAAAPSPTICTPATGARAWRCASASSARSECSIIMRTSPVAWRRTT